MTLVLPLPQIQKQLSGESFQFRPHHSMILSEPSHEPRLSLAIGRLFPGVEIKQTSLTAKWPYVLYWGPNEELADALLLNSYNEIPDQGYVLAMRDQHIVLFAPDAAGLFYGLHTLVQKLDDKEHRASHGLEIFDYPDTAVRVMNFDFRQTFSKPELLIEYMAKMAALKTNALLIEYEDKFPFKRSPGRHFVHPRHALTITEFDALQQAAYENFIEIIPLQQSFGHLEFILGREEYRNLRETIHSTGELCPLKEEAFEIVTSLISEIAEKHPHSRYLHLGCDEVYSLCDCPVCKRTFNGSKHEAFIYFVNRLIDYTCQLGKTPIIWQDMLDDHCPDSVLEKLDPRVTVMIWHYNGKNISGLVGPLAMRLRTFGIEVWGAPAVRCFDRKDDQNYPLIESRLSNIDQWTQVAKQLELYGLVGTNWTATFSLGVPYGIFETTWYTMAYFADLSWNRTTRNESDRFIDRFILVFHGIDPAKAAAMIGPYTDEDYYELAAKLLPLAEDNVDVLELISSMLDFERASDRSRTIHKYSYRHILNPDSEAEWRSLMNNYRNTHLSLQSAKVRMEHALNVFQPTDMASHYIFSRYHIHEHLEETLYKPMGLVLEPREKKM